MRERKSRFHCITFLRSLEYKQSTMQYKRCFNKRVKCAGRELKSSGVLVITSPYPRETSRWVTFIRPTWIKIETLIPTKDIVRICMKDLHKTSGS